MLYATHATVHLDAIRSNMEAIRAHVGLEHPLMVVVKANGYGLGAVEIARMAEGMGYADWLGIATVPEGMKLRDAGITLPLLKLSDCVAEDEVQAALRYGITLTVSAMDSATMVEKVSAELSLPASVHLKLDTGMHRLGATAADALVIARLLEDAPHIDFQGVFTHLPVSDTPARDEETRAEIALFRDEVAAIEAEIGHRLAFVHCANSGAVLGMPEALFPDRDPATVMVRPGILVYGYRPDSTSVASVDVQPCAEWSTNVSFVKRLQAGDRVGYGLTWAASTPTWIATIPVGYADGFSRLNSNRGRVLIGGRPYPIVGRICMDQTMVDLGPETDVTPGDAVTLIGRQGEQEITADEIAELMGTIVYEVLCLLTPRVTRVYTGGKIGILARDLAETMGITTDADVEITGVSHNSAWIEPGDLYTAIRGARFDGHTFIADAVQRGAVAVMGDGLRQGESCPVPYLTVPHTRRALATAAAALEGNPADKLTVIGITGTDGKTTTSLLTTYLLRCAGRKVGVISTVGYQGIDGVLRQFPAHFTTPEAPQLQHILAGHVAEGADTVVLEASSHALAQERVGGIRYDVGVWTHLSREHLDFHKDMESYFAAKRILIERSAKAVLNVDDPWTEGLRGICPVAASYSTAGATADFVATDIQESRDGLRFHLTVGDRRTDVTMPLVGSFNVANATAALAAVAAVGVDPIEAAAWLEGFPGVPGRMQFVPTAPDQPRIIVDFAHTPDALDKALSSLRPSTNGVLWCVLGAAGGPRDTGRIAPMGETVARLSDRVVFTEDDTYDTDLAMLLGELQRGAATVPDAQVEVIPDRREAIAHVVAQARPEDTILLAGKGHERELMRPTPIPWSDVDEALAALRS